jgi:hypothetical protein
MSVVGWFHRMRLRLRPRHTLQHQTCERFGAKCVPAAPRSKAGVALQTRGRFPLNALRHPPEHGTCGWYVWWGDTLTQDPHFFSALHVEHLSQYCPEFMPYAWLPPGWRVQVAPGHEEVWFDVSLLSPSESKRT